MINNAFGANLKVNETYFYLSPGDEREKRNILKERHRESEGTPFLYIGIRMMRTSTLFYLGRGHWWVKVRITKTGSSKSQFVHVSRGTTVFYS